MDKQLRTICSECGSRNTWLDLGEQPTRFEPGYLPVCYCRRCGHEWQPSQADWHQVNNQPQRPQYRSWAILVSVLSALLAIAVFFATSIDVKAGMSSRVANDILGMGLATGGLLIIISFVFFCLRRK